MNRSLKEVLSLILLLTAASMQLCQAYPDTSNTQNEEVAEEFATNVQTLSQIEEDNPDQLSEGDLKRQSRKVPCPFHKLKSGLTKAAAIPCGAAAGAAAAAVAGKSVGASIGGTSSGEAMVRSGSLGRTSFGGSIGGTGVTEVAGGGHFGHLTNTFDMISDEIVDISSSLHGAFSSLQELLLAMPVVLANLRTEVEAINAPVELRYEVAQTCDNYARAEKGISGIINHIHSFFKLPTFRGQAQVRNNFEIGSCLDNFKSNMMNFLAAVRSWFSCDKLFSSNKGITKFQSYINSIPSSSQCNILNGLGKSSGDYVLIPHGKGEAYYSVGGSGGFHTGAELTLSRLQKQIEECQKVLEVMAKLPAETTELLQGMQAQLGSNLDVMISQRAQPYYQVPVPMYQVPIHPLPIRPQNVMRITPSLSGQAHVNINQRISDVPATKFYVAPVQPPPIPAPFICSGQSVVDSIYKTVSAPSGNMNSARSALDLLNVKINLSRDTVYTLLNGQIPAAGDIIMLNLTDDIMIVGSPSDDYSPITFIFIYRGISTKTRYNNNVQVWNLPEDEFICNQNIFNDIVGHLVYG